MSSDLKTGLSAALLQTGPVAPIDALRYAVSWATQSLATEVGEDDVAALRCVRALNGVLPELTELLRLVPDLIRVADPGGPVSERIAAYQAELSRQLARLAAERAALEEAGDLERQVQETDSEHNRLRTRIDELEHGQQLAAELPDLQARQTALEAAVAEAGAGDGAEVVHGLTEAAHQLLQLTDEQRSLLGAELARLVAEATDAAERVAAERDRRDEQAHELTARLAEAEQLRQEYQRTLPALELHRRADQDLADGLSSAGLSAEGSGLAPEGSGLARARAALADIAQRITDLDNLLRPLLQEHTRAYEEATKVRTWSG